MKTTLLATLLAAGLGLQSAPAAAWYQWQYQDIPFAAVPGLPLAQGIPYGIPGINPFVAQTLPWLGFYQPNLLHWWMMPAMSSGTYVEQTQSPAGYHIRVQTPGGGLANLQIAVEAGAIVIRSSEHTMGATPFQTRQSGWSNRWVQLPADANLAATRMGRIDGGVEIFVPRWRAGSN